VKVKLKKEKLTEFDAPIAKHMETSLVVASFMTIKMIYILSFGLLRMNIKVIFFARTTERCTKKRTGSRQGNHQPVNFHFNSSFTEGRRKFRHADSFILEL